MTVGRGTARERGFALLVVLWSLSLIALLGTQITAAGHSETRLATNLRNAAVAEAAADGAVFETAFHLLDGSSQGWALESFPRRLKTQDGEIVVAVVDESRKISMNSSPLALLRGLFRALGEEPRAADVLSQQVADWRSPANYPLRLGAKAPQYRAAGRAWGPPNAPFRSVDELALVLNVTPDLYARARPYLSPYIESAPRNFQLDPVISRAMQDSIAANAQPLAFDEPPTLTVFATATVRGARFTRRAVIRIPVAGAANPGDRVLTVLAWERPDD